MLVSEPGYMCSLIIPERSICDLPTDVAMGFIHILDTAADFESAGFWDIVDRLSVNNPRDHGDEVFERLVGAGRVDLTANFRCW